MSKVQTPNGLDQIQRLVAQIEINATEMAVFRERYNLTMTKAHCAHNESDAAHYQKCAEEHLEDFKAYSEEVRKHRRELERVLLRLQLQLANNATI